MEGAAVVAGMGVTLGVGVVTLGGTAVTTGGTGVAVGIGAGKVNWLLHTGPAVMFIHGILGMVSF